MSARNDARTQEGVNRQWVAQDNGERSLGDLLTGLTTDLSTLLRQEVQLAKVETMEKVNHATQSIVLMAAGGFVAYGGFLAIIAAMVAGFSLWFSLSIWLSALLVGVLWIVVGLICLQIGRSTLQQVNVVPEKTLETMKGNVDMIKEKTS